MSSRSFPRESSLTGGRLTLQVASALTPSGVVERPSFVHGFVAHPTVVARSLVVLADITATRYFNHTPESQRDPVLSAQGDRLRAECFSACNGVYARLDLLGSAFDTAEIGRGTTNVDIGPQLRALLTGVSHGELLHLDVGDDGLALATPARQSRERPVAMPDRWVRALGSVAELHHTMVPAFELDRAAAQRFIGSLPPVTATRHSGWLTPFPDGARISARRSASSVRVAGLHRWTALRRVLPHVRSLTVYGPTGSTADEIAAIEVELPAARLVLVTTAEAWRGFSGEGSLLPTLAAAGQEPIDVDSVVGALRFESVIDTAGLARTAGVGVDDAKRALALAAASGIVGWDAHEGAWFHRELPYDPDRVDRGNPRLIRARRLGENGQVTHREGDTWAVGPADAAHRVTVGGAGLATATCTCPWYLRHRSGRGPCAHVLAVHLVGRGPS